MCDCYAGYAATPCMIAGYRSANLIDKRLVPTLHAPEPAVEHGPMGQDGGKTFVVEFKGNAGKSLAELPGERTHTLLVFRRCSVGLHGQSHHDTLDRLTLHVIRQELHQLGRGHRGQPVGYDLGRVCHGDSRALFPIIYGEDSAHSCKVSANERKVWRNDVGISPALFQTRS